MEQFLVPESTLRTCTSYPSPWFPVPVVQFGDKIEKGGATIKAQSEIGNHDIHVDLHVATCHAAKTGGKDVTRTVGLQL